MAKHVYRAKANMAGVRNGEMFEAEDDDPRVKTGLVEKLTKAEVPKQVADALAGGAPAAYVPADAPEGAEGSSKG